LVDLWRGEKKNNHTPQRELGNYAVRTGKPSEKQKKTNSTLPGGGKVVQTKVVSSD